MEQTYDVIVVGGGIIGNAIAYELAKEQQRVAIIEEATIGSKTTRAAAGMLGAHSEYDGEADAFFSFARHSQSRYATLAKELHTLTGIDIAMQGRGILKLAFTEEEKQKLQTLCEQPTVTWLDAAHVKQMEPTVSNAIIGAAHIQHDVHILPLRACEAFAKGAVMRGATLYEHTSVQRIDKKGDSFHVDTTRGLLKAKQVVIAAGVWSNVFFKQLGLPHDITPVKGECMAVQARNVHLAHTLFHEQCYIVPRSNGELVIGATMKPNDWSTDVTLNGIETLVQKAKMLLPAIGELAITRTWAGLRPAHDTPMIGVHPHDEALFFATGHGRNGILLAPATAELIKNLLLKKETRTEWVNAFQLKGGNTHDYGQWQASTTC